MESHQEMNRKKTTPQTVEDICQRYSCQGIHMQNQKRNSTSHLEKERLLN